MKLMRMKKLVLVLLAVLLGLGIVGARAEQARADTAAVRVNTKDDSSLFKLAFGIRRVMNGVVDESNAAVAYASCERCRTVAISIQIVLVMSDPTTVTPTNVAVAVNENCSLCETFAAAYQFVVSTRGPVRFTSQGERDLEDIRSQLADLKDNSDLTIAEIQQRVSALVDRLRTVLATELVPVGPGETAEPEQTTQQETQGTLNKKPDHGQTSTTQSGETVTPPAATSTDTVPTSTTDTTSTSTDTTPTTTDTTSTSTDTTPTTTDTTPTTTTATP